MEDSKRKKLLSLLADQSLSFGAVPLSSGRSSDYYIDGKMVATTPEGAPLIAEAIRDLIGDIQIDAVGGITIGADPMLGALSGRGYFRTFIVRKEPKKHGLSKWVEGQLTDQDRRVVFIDDVATSGSSILKGIEIIKSEFPLAEIVKVIVLVDREEGAKKNLEKHGYALESVFTAEELMSEKNKMLGGEKCGFKKHISS